MKNIRIKGFTVIGVAREQGSDARMKEAIKKTAILG